MAKKNKGGTKGRKDRAGKPAGSVAHMTGKLFDDEPPHTLALFPGELEPPSPEQERAYADAAKRMRKAGDEPVNDREKFEQVYSKERTKRRR
jgi:hypothetical protein